MGKNKLESLPDEHTRFRALDCTPHFREWKSAIERSSEKKRERPWRRRRRTRNYSRSLE